MIKKLFAFLTVLILLSAGVAAAEILPPETPAPVRFHEAPAATPEPPPILDTTRDVSCLDGLRFRLDTKLLHIWFPIIANAEEDEEPSLEEQLAELNAQKEAAKENVKKAQNKVE